MLCDVQGAKGLGCGQVGHVEIELKVPLDKWVYMAAYGVVWQ